MRKSKVPVDVTNVLMLDTLDKAIDIAEAKNEYYKAIADKIEQSLDSSMLEPPEEVKKRRDAKKQSSAFNKEEYISVWDFIELAANIFQFTGSFVLLIDVLKIPIGSTAVGLGCFFSWINLIQHLRYTPRYYNHFRAILMSIPSVMKLVIGMMSMYVGYAFFGTAVFWQSHRFESVNRTMLTLFALMNCDGIFQLFEELSELNFLVAQLYLYSFIFIFVCVGQNLFLGVVYKIYAIDTRQKKSAKEGIGKRDKDIYKEKKKEVI